ncbi:MAG: acylphosphatase [Patescibacteria group bacterium]|nr:acylphosphatase [Patescibacteria group bacterium]
MKHITVKISGKVQGVFFRYWTKKEADKLNICGWVRNELDGSVLIEAEGEDKNLHEFCMLCENGSKGAIVETIDVKWNENKKGYKKFEIKH